MKLRFVEDRRTLLWACVLFPLGPTLALWRPSLTLWLTPLLLYCSYLSGVLSHNHNHCPVFVSRRANALYSAWLSFFFGFPTFGWVPSHNQNHHRFLNDADDASSTARNPRSDGILTFLTYPLVCSRHQLPLVYRYAYRQLRAGGPQASRIVLEVLALVVGHAALLLLALYLHGASVGACVYVVAVGLPALLANYWMMLTNYLQHVGCSPHSRDDHSRNFVSPWWNWFVFDNGFHTVHHEQPGQHWSRYRAIHRQREPLIDPTLNQRFILGYALRRYATPQHLRVATPGPVGHGNSRQ